MFRLSLRFLKRPFKVERRSANLPHFDVCVIGGGPAGFAAALRAVDYKKRVCLIEKNRLGGADLWDGALQSKALWDISKFVSQVSGKSALRVFDPEYVAPLKDKISNERIQENLRKVSEGREENMKTALNRAGVTFIHGQAMFASPREIDVHSIGTGEYQTLSADYFIIATGSTPRKHPHFAYDQKRIISSDLIMRLPIPKSIVIIGAGVVGCEFASIFANLGCTKVSLIDKAPRILPMEDQDIALSVQDQLVARGVTIHHDSSLFDLQSWEGEKEGEGGCHYTVQDKKTLALKTFEVECALVSIGRDPNYRGLALENTGCKVTDGRVNVDKYNRCLPHEHIYAVGDASVDIALVSVGEQEARNVVDFIYCPMQVSSTSSVTDHAHLSTIMFLEHPMAAVGLNEQQCRKRRISYIVARYSYEFVSLAQAMSNQSGFVKLIVTNDAERRLLGVRAFGPHSTSVIEVVSLAIRRNQSAYDLLDLSVAYPSVVQGLVECVRLVVGRSILKPNVFPGVMLNSWEPPMFHRGRAYQNTLLQDAKVAKEEEKVLDTIVERHRMRLDEIRGEKEPEAQEGNNSNDNKAEVNK